MSRIGKQPIPIPEKVEVAIDGAKIRVKGPLGQLERALPPMIFAEQKDRVLMLKPKPDSPKGTSALYGTARAQVANMVLGVHQGFQKNLDVVGLGFKASVTGDKLTLNIGYSHPVDFSIPKDIKIEVDKKLTKITIHGIDKNQVGETAAQIRGLRPPEPYKGTGIRYEGERIHRKAGKTAAGVGGGAGGAAGGAKK